MKLIEMKCPGCGASLQAEEGRKVVYCEYCGTPVQIDDESLRIRVTNTFVNEAAVRSIDLERQKFETETRQKEMELADQKKKKEEWNRYLLMYLGVLAVSFLLMMLLGNVRYIGTFISSLAMIVLIFGGIGIYFLKPDRNTAKKAETMRITMINASDKDKMVTFVLCLLLGYFGAHHFYAGNTSKGVLYFFTIGLFGFGWLIDLVLILLNRFKDRYGRVICR